MLRKIETTLSQTGMKKRRSGTDHNIHYFYFKLFKATDRTLAKV